MKRKTFLQIFLLTLVCISILFVYGIIAVKSNSKTIIKERLKEETKLACSLIKSTDDFDCFSDYYNDNALRITVIDLEGNVLFESDTKAPLENHIDREEIRNAIKNTPQAVERYSDTFGCEMTYYALKTELDDGTKVILRMALKSSHINGYFIITLPILFMVLCISLGFSIVFSDVISKKVTSKITDVGKSLRSLNDGNYAPIKTSSDEPELYSVLNEINELNSSIHKHIRRETEERNKLDTVLENVYQGILAIGRNKKIIFANKSVMKLFGCAEEPSGNDVVFLIDDLALCNLISEHLGEDFGGEYLYKGKELSVVIKNADGAEAGNECSIVIFTDVTKEKEMAKQKNDFFANASHELKTPVAVMQGLSELLLAKNLDESSEKQVERIHKESLRLSSLITDMLELSRLENGGQSEMILSKVNLKETAEEALGELSAKMAEKGVTATVTGNGTIDGDAKKIYELVENLCGNAVNYNKENGKIAVDITESGDNVILKVSDTGIGIEKENIPRLCERFYRVDKSRSKKTGGTGLGLAIVKHICALHNATLSIDSDIGLGTSVTVTFIKSNR
ncbi:MAG: ATP-binding protein [Clostridiales bacterium]|nr:ATP-binding protein [Clostridiales bacterium]